MRISTPQFTIQRLMIVVAGSAGVMWFARLLRDYPNLQHAVWLIAGFVLAMALYLLGTVGGILFCDAIGEHVNLEPARDLWCRLTGQPRPRRSRKPTRRDGPR